MAAQFSIPPETAGDNDTDGMIRVWLAHGELHLSLLLGKWADAGNDDAIDERDGW